MVYISIYHPILPLYMYMYIYGVYIYGVIICINKT